MTTVNVQELETKVQDMYREVAENPHGEFHFEMGRALAERLGYPAVDLDRIPAEAIESFAGVGYFFHLARLQPGECVVDLGSGSGMDTFLAARAVGASGRVIGVDMTDAQRQKAERLRDRDGFRQTEYRKGYIEELPVEANTADCVMSNGVINLSPDKARVFGEAARVLKPGGRLAIADIVTDVQLPETVVCNATLWAACIGGAMQVDGYRREIEAAGLLVDRLEENTAYRFISDRAHSAARKYGVKSISLVARRP
jgi:ubiquinone/menaquinone biosynthesis C-methylase UbiE